MTRTLILHVGSPKCGSTYLQRVLLGNRAALTASGVTYPHPGGGGHPGTPVTLGGLDRDRLDRLFGAQSTLVLSHEDYFGQAQQAVHLAEAVSGTGTRVHVLVFLRPFSGFLFGDYSQFLKQNLDRYIAEGACHDGRSFERFAADRARSLAITGYLRAWRRVLPEATLTVARHGDIRTVVSQVLPCVALDWSVPIHKANPSLRMWDCDEIARAVSAGLPPEVIRGMLRLALDKTALPDPGRTAERVAWAEALFGRQRDEIREEFGLDLDLCPVDEPARRAA